MSQPHEGIFTAAPGSRTELEVRRAFAEAEPEMEDSRSARGAPADRPQLGRGRGTAVLHEALPTALVDVGDGDVGGEASGHDALRVVRRHRPSDCGGGRARPGGYDALKIEALDCPREPLWGIPRVHGTVWIPRELTCWTESARAQWLDGIHFFTEDYRFERVWNAPARYRGRLSKASVLCGPDFSVYRDWPRAANLWNVYRSRWLCALWESWGLAVAPTLTWAGPDSWSFCFLGVPSGVTVAVSTVGAGEDETSRRWFADGYAEAVRRLEPHCVLVYGKAALPAALEELAPVRYFGTPRIDAMKTRGIAAGAARPGQLRMEGT